MWQGKGPCGKGKGHVARERGIFVCQTNRALICGIGNDFSFVSIKRDNDVSYEKATALFHRKQI